MLILGSGPAGYTAAIYAARALLKPILVFGSEPGGQLTTTTDVENFPGFSKVIQGPWLMEEMKGQAKAVGTEMIQDHISKSRFKKKPFDGYGDSGQVYSAESIIISTGAQARWLNLNSEKNLEVLVFLLVLHVMVFFLKIKKSQLLVEETLLWKKQCFLPSLHQR